MMIAGDKKMMIFFNSSLKTRWFTPGITTPGSWNPCTGCCSSSSVSCLLFSWSAVWFLRAILVSHEEEIPRFFPPFISFWWFSGLFDSFLFSLKIIIIDHLLRLKYTLMRFSHSPTKTHSLSMFCSPWLNLLTHLLLRVWSALHSLLLSWLQDSR